MKYISEYNSYEKNFFNKVKVPYYRLISSLLKKNNIPHTNGIYGGKYNFSLRLLHSPEHSIDIVKVENNTYLKYNKNRDTEHSETFTVNTEEDLVEKFSYCLNKHVLSKKYFNYIDDYYSEITKALEEKNILYEDYKKHDNKTFIIKVLTYPKYGAAIHMSDDAFGNKVVRVLYFRNPNIKIEDLSFFEDTNKDIIVFMYHSVSDFKSSLNPHIFHEDVFEYNSYEKNLLYQGDNKIKIYIASLIKDLEVKYFDEHPTSVFFVNKTTGEIWMEDSKLYRVLYTSHENIWAKIESRFNIGKYKIGVLLKHVVDFIFNIEVEAPIPVTDFIEMRWEDIVRYGKNT